MSAKSPKDLSDTIISFVTDRQQKIAMIVAKVVRAYEARGIQIESTKVGARICKLVGAGKLVAVGDVASWRFSEICLPATRPVRARAKRQTVE